MALRDTAMALRHINDERLRFPVLFILMPEISTHELYSRLSPRNRVAIILCSKKIYKHIMDTPIDAMNDDQWFQTLKWMFETGRDWDGPSDGHDPYDAVIDYIAALLIVTYEDKSILKDVAGLIFRRNRQGHFIHDLVWSFFQTLDKDALVLISQYLLSENPRDVELAAKLLCIQAPVLNRDKARKIQRQFLDWFDDNKPYLYLTGEHFQMTSNPRHLDADTEAKYLGKEISPRFRAPIEPLTEEEIECLRQFRAAAPEDQVQLTVYSHKLRNSDLRLWYEWMRKQLAEQVLAARATYEVT
jgi:hypothetical protein